jgi:hypothetical protein
MAMQLARDTSQTPERRAYQRVPVALAGKTFFPATDLEQDCIVTDISLGGVALQFGEPPEAGTELVLYMPGFDRFSGTVVRSDSRDVGMRFNCSAAKRERTAEKIALYRNGTLPQDTKMRQSNRAAIPATRRFRRPDGEVVTFEVRDISLTGASLKTSVRPPLGEIVMIGATAGRVTRHFDEGIAVEFVKTAGEV